MNSAIHELANAVLKKPLQDCSLEELRHLAQQHPYFGPAQLLLAKKLSGNLPGYEEQVQKTSLYFPNRVWLDHLLNDKNNGTSGVTIAREETFVVPEEQYQPAEPVISPPMKPDIVIENSKEQITEQQSASADNASTSVEEVPEHLVNEPQQGPAPAAKVSNEQTEESNPVPFEMPPLKTDPSIVNEDEGLLFEPYHTVDYFASQGIKAKEEEKPKDRLSVQLKSFTEWLKVLKRASSGEIIAPGDPIAEKKVEQMAEYSIAERHVITEAMAEVWKKQGNKGKAEEIYRKLSLLDPSKSSYFAAKIEELKKTS